MARDRFEEVTVTGYGKKLKQSLSGMIVGLLMFVAAFPLQFWNEGRAVAQSKALDEGAGAVVAVGNESVAGANAGKLVHISGRATVSAPVVDPTFGISARGLALKRQVEMYQWREKRESREEKQLGGGTKTVTTYRYDKVWSDEVEKSSEFRERSGHENPDRLPFETERFAATDVKLGAFRLGPEITGDLRGWQSVAPDLASLPPNLAASFRVEGDAYYAGSNAAAPQVGDLRVTFKVLPESDLSVVGQQQDDTLVEYTASNGNTLLLVETGKVPAAKMFESAHRQNTILTWILRAIGFGMMWIGLSMALAPLATLLDVIPMLGTLVAKGVGLVTAIIAFVFSLLTIGLAWVFYRPLLGIALIALAVGGVVWLKRRKAASLPAGPPPGPVAMPPPPPPPK